jgi:hypothetical protein
LRQTVTHPSYQSTLQPSRHQVPASGRESPAVPALQLAKLQSSGQDVTWFDEALPAIPGIRAADVGVGPQLTALDAQLGRIDLELTTVAGAAARA